MIQPVATRPARRAETTVISRGGGSNQAGRRGPETAPGVLVSSVSPTAVRPKDVSLVLFSNLDATFSLGYAEAFREGTSSGEVMVSLKLLR